MQPIEVIIFKADIDLLFPKGLIGIKERNLLFVIQALMLLIIIPVFLLTFIFSWRYRAHNKKSTYDPDLVDNTIAEVIWWGIPIIMVAIVAVITYIETHKLDPYKPIKSDKKTIDIEVVALQWKWLFIYPEQKIATVNYLQIPKDTPIHFKITSDAPMNSFWIPELGGQIYAMPGMQTELYLIANQEGRGRGCSANISGEGFAGMHFEVETTSEKDFEVWANSTKGDATNLDFDLYQKIAAPSKNVPPMFYQVKDENLFSMILMKYMAPAKHKE
jgi:cytochrome o ubiquinol oxidase subunit 2